MSKKFEVKNLNVEIEKAEKELAEYRKEVSHLNQLLNEKKYRLHSLKLKKRKQLKVNNLSITDSAIISYLEKVCNFDMQKIRETILPVKLKSDDDYIADGWYDMGDFEIQVKKGRVVWVDVEYDEENDDEK